MITNYFRIRLIMPLNSYSELYSNESVRRIDQAAINAGTPAIVLMKRAGRDAFVLLRDLWPECARLVVICGGGNNGGDGYVIAALAKQAGLDVTLYCSRDSAELHGASREAADYARQEGVDSHDLAVLLGDASEPFVVDEPKLEPQSTVIVDALLGTGLRGDIRGLHQDAIEWMNGQNASVFAVDVPSGLSADFGSYTCVSVCAAATITFVGVKQGLLTGDARECCGALYFSDLGIPDRIRSRIKPSAALLRPQAYLHELARDENSHKGAHGHAAIVGGGESMGGAAMLGAEASLYCGAGLVSLHLWQDSVPSALTRLPEVMVSPLVDPEALDVALRSVNAIGLGPGLGKTQWSVDVCERVLALPQMKVIDADALNLIASGCATLPADSNHIMTPHPGEAARLLDVSIQVVQTDRFQAARDLQLRYGGVVVLKGAGTIITDASGQWLCDKGNPGMAVAGMGDVLVGVIVALLSQGLSPLASAQLGVWLHSTGADDAVAESGMIGVRASDVIPFIRKRINAK